MKTFLLGGLCSLITSFIFGLFHIYVFKKINAGQPILKYVESHKEKQGTPTCGGLFFVLSALLIFAFFGGFSGRIAAVSVSCGLAFLIVGFIDDFIKLKFKNNQGLKAYQKMAFQAVIAIIVSIFMYENGLTFFYVPFIKKYVDFGFYTIPFSIFIFLALTNSVNLTDGLDGLAGSITVVFIVAIIILIELEKNMFSTFHLTQVESENIQLLAICLVGGILGFLIFNTNKASVFMGDTGSLSLGGFISCLSLFTFNGLFIPILGIMFVLSSISVIIQVVSFKLRRKRVFLMTPLHHHFQIKGYRESKIVFSYFTISCIMAVLSIIFYL